MAIIVKSKIGKNDLVTRINELIQSAKIDTWSKDSEGDYTHIGQWQNKAWFKPYDNDEEKIIFGIIGRKDERMTKETYAVYHGRFVEMLLAHFDNFIEEFEITSAKMELYDRFD